MPLAVREDWTQVVGLVTALSVPDARWEGQVTLVRRWYEPHLLRLYDASMARAADLEQLEHIAAQFAAREQFLSELALDPPRASSDLAGPPLLDEDYLILSTIHSAKGQEWDRVSILHVSDGTFPSEFATGKAELIEEERRLLYVAMTRARHELDLVTPLKYYVAHQVRQGDTHVYGTRSRFLSGKVTAALEVMTWPAEARAAEPSAKVDLPRIDVASRLRKLWA